MKLTTLNFKGHFEDEGDVAERLQMVEPENDLERNLLAWILLPQGETVSDDPARPNYIFNYELGQYLERGLYRLKLTSRDASGAVWTAEIAAGLTVTGGAVDPQRDHDYTRFWFISKHLHFKASDPRVAEHYPGHAFGHLNFGDSVALPHDRLFRATA